MGSEICVIGGINMDLVVRVPHIPRPGETVQGGEVARYPGGKGANQAVAARRLGEAVALIGQVGMDAFGDELLAGLRAAGIACDGVRRVAHATGVALITVAPGGENAIVVAPGANMAWDESALAEVERRAARCRLLVLNLEVPPDVIARAIAVAKRAGAQVLLNPAPHRKGDEASFGGVDLLVPNQVEAAQFAGLEPDGVEDWVAVGERLRSLGPRAVIVTLGAAGALVLADGEAARVAGFRVPVVDTTAAGDAFVGGLASAVLRGRSLPEAVRFANACGALAVTKTGAQPSLPDGAAVERLLATGERS